MKKLLSKNFLYKICFFENLNFNDCYELAISTLENLKSSSTLLEVSVKLVDKKDYCIYNIVK